MDIFDGIVRYSECIFLHPFNNCIRNYNLEPQLNLIFDGSWRSNVIIMVTSDVSNLTFTPSQDDRHHIISVPKTIFSSIPDVKLALFQLLFGVDEIVPGDHNNFWSEFLNFINLHPTFKTKLSRKLEDSRQTSLQHINWKMSDLVTGIRFISKCQTLLTTRYNTMTSFYHQALMEDLKSWINEGPEEDGEEEGVEQFSIPRGQFRQDGPRLPAGWEWRRDLNGRTLYIDHNNQLTTLHRPSLASVFPDNNLEVPNNQNYRRVVSSEDDTQWDPTAPNEEEVDNDDDQSPSAPVVPGDSGLPEGWEMKFTEAGMVFYIDHNTRTTSWHHPRTPQPLLLDREDSLELQPLPEGWEEKYTDKGKVFFIDHKNKKTTWEDPRFGLAPRTAGRCPQYSAQYKRKLEILMEKLESKRSSSKTEIKVRRAMVVEDSFREVGKIKESKVLRSKIWIDFSGEAGLDYGGVSREWFHLVSTKLFNPYYGLFEYSANDVYTLQINPDSGLYNEHHLQLFHFLGRIVGMAVFHKKLVNGFFIRPFYSMMLGRKIGLEDMQYVDEFYYNSLVHILENDPGDYGMTFQVSFTRLGETVYEDLVPEGDRIPVTNDNKLDYIDRVVEWRFVSRVKVLRQRDNTLQISTIPRNKCKVS